MRSDGSISRGAGVELGVASGIGVNFGPGCSAGFGSGFASGSAIGLFSWNVFCCGAGVGDSLPAYGAALLVDVAAHEEQPPEYPPYDAAPQPPAPHGLAQELHGLAQLA